MRRLPAVLCAVLLAAACANGNDVDPFEEDVLAPTPVDGAIPTVEVAETSLGDTVVDADGMTMYLFTNDTSESSACTGGCAETWPPLVVTGEPVAGEGVDATLLATIGREDGSTQVTYGGNPLYGYAPDQQPGDVNGHGFNEVWFAVGPDGTAVESRAQ